VSEFPVFVHIDVRFRDLDPLGHVNNAVYLSYAETARVEYFLRLGYEVGSGHFILARAEVDYRRPIVLHDDVRVMTRVSRVGNSSFRMVFEVWANGELAARGETIQVWLEQGRPSPLPEALRQAIRRLETQPVEGL
jgi:acyl-CoA thioester hydrolase